MSDTNESHQLSVTPETHKLSQQLSVTPETNKLSFANTQSTTIHTWWRSVSNEIWFIQVHTKKIKLTKIKGPLFLFTANRLRDDVVYQKLTSQR